MVVELGRFDWAQGDKFPSLTEPEPAYHGLKFFENFGDFAFTTKARAVALRDFGPTLSPMNAFLTIDRHRNACMCAWSGMSPTRRRWPSSSPATARRLGLLCRAQVEPVS